VLQALEVSLSAWNCQYQSFSCKGTGILPEPGVDLGYYEAPGAQHNEAAWAARVGPMLTFLFPKE